MPGVSRTLSPAILALGLALPLLACRAPDVIGSLEVRNVETYWVVDSSIGDTRYIAPAVRFEVRNKTGEPHGAIQATASFRRKGEESQTWGSDWQQVVKSGKPLGPGESVDVLLRSDGRYYSTGPPETMFQHQQWRDAKVEVFLRMGSSGWVKFADADVERRIGARSVQAVAQ